MIGQLGFWTYLHELMKASSLKFHDVAGQQIFPVYSPSGDVTTTIAVVVMRADGKSQQIDFKVSAYTSDEADRIMEEIAMKAHA